MLASYAYVRLDAQKSLQTCMHISLDFLDVTYFPGASGGRRIAPPRHLLSRQSPARTIATGDRLTVYSERGYLLRWLGDSGKAAIERGRGSTSDLKEILIVMINVQWSYHRVRRAFLGDYGVLTIRVPTRHRRACPSWRLLPLLAVRLDDPAQHGIRFVNNVAFTNIQY